MPPKRKRNDTEAQLTSSTGRPRGSSRSGPSEAATERGSKTRGSATDQPKPRVSRGSAPSVTSKKKAKSSNAQMKSEASESVSESEEKPPPRKKGKKSSELSTSSKKKVTSTALFSPYSRRSMETLFATYADEQDRSTIGAEGLEKLCIEANIPMEGVQPLILAWLLEASELGKFTVKEWVKGLDALRIDNLEKLSCALSEYECLLVSEIAATKQQSNDKTANESYNRDLHYWMYATDVHKSFLKFYTFVFLLAKSPQERNIDIEMAKTFWEVLLSKRYPIVNDLIEFINEKGTLKGVNKDLWGMTLDFCKTFNTSLEGFEADGAWPTVLDEFYAWKQARGSTNVLEGVDQAGK